MSNLLGRISSCLYPIFNNSNKTSINTSSKTKDSATTESAISKQQESGKTINVAAKQDSFDNLLEMIAKKEVDSETLLQYCFHEGGFVDKIKASSGNNNASEVNNVADATQQGMECADDSTESAPSEDNVGGDTGDIRPTKHGNTEGNDIASKTNDNQTTKNESGKNNKYQNAVKQLMEHRQNPLFSLLGVKSLESMLGWKSRGFHKLLAAIFIFQEGKNAFLTLDSGEKCLSTQRFITWLNKKMLERDPSFRIHDHINFKYLTGIYLDKGNNIVFGKTTYKNILPWNAFFLPVQKEIKVDTALNPDHIQSEQGAALIISVENSSQGGFDTQLHSPIKELRQDQNNAQDQTGTTSPAVSTPIVPNTPVCDGCLVVDEQEWVKKLLSNKKDKTTQPDIFATFDFLIRNKTDKNGFVKNNFEKLAFEKTYSVKKFFTLLLYHWYLEDVNCENNQPSFEEWINLKLSEYTKECKGQSNGGSLTYKNLYAIHSYGEFNKWDC